MRPYGGGRAVSRLIGTTLLPCLWPKDAEGSGGGNFPPLGGSQHRICLDTGFRRRSQMPMWGAAPYPVEQEEQ